MTESKYLHNENLHKLLGPRPPRWRGEVKYPELPYSKLKDFSGRTWVDKHGYKTPFDYLNDDHFIYIQHDTALAQKVYAETIFERDAPAAAQVIEKALLAGRAYRP